MSPIFTLLPTYNRSQELEGHFQCQLVSDTWLCVPVQQHWLPNWYFTADRFSRQLSCSRKFFPFPFLAYCGVGLLIWIHYSCIFPTSCRLFRSSPTGRLCNYSEARRISRHCCPTHGKTAAIFPQVHQCPSSDGVQILRGDGQGNNNHTLAFWVADLLFFYSRIFFSRSPFFFLPLFLFFSRAFFMFANGQIRKSNLSLWNSAKQQRQLGQPWWPPTSWHLTSLWQGKGRTGTGGEKLKKGGKKEYLWHFDYADVLLYLAQCIGVDHVTLCLYPSIILDITLQLRLVALSRGEQCLTKTSWDQAVALSKQVKARG